MNAQLESRWSEYVTDFDVDAASVVIAVFDAFGVPSYANPGMRLFLGGKTGGPVSRLDLVEPDLRTLGENPDDGLIFDGNASVGDGSGELRVIRSKIVRSGADFLMVGELDEGNFSNSDRREEKLNAEIVRLKHALAQTRKTLEDALRDRDKIATDLSESRNKLQEFAESVSDWFWETDADHRFTYISEIFDQFGGVGSRDRSLGKKRWELAVDGADEEHWHQYRQNIEARQPFKDFQYDFWQPDGKTRAFRVSGWPIIHEDGTFVGYRGTGRDVTDLVRETRERQRSERLFLDAIATIPIAIALFDDQDRLVMWNRLYEGFIAKDIPLEAGIGFEELLRRNIASGRIPEAIGCEDAWMQARMAYHRSPDGTRETKFDKICVRVREHWTRDGNSILMIHDISATKQVEATLHEQRNLLEAIIDTVPVPLFWKDRDGRYLGCNNRFLSDRGIDRRENVVGKMYHDFVRDPRDAAEIQKEDDMVLNHGRSLLNQEKRRGRADGTERIHLSSKVPMRGPQGEVVGLIGTFLDITERVQAQEKVTAQRTLLKAMMDAIPLGVFWKNRAGVYMGCNDHYLKDRGATRPDDVIGKTVFDIVLDQDEAKMIAERDERIMAQAKAEIGFEDWARKPDGSTRVHLSSKVPIRDSSGDVVGLVCAYLDITERKRNEALLRQSQKLQSLGNMAAGLAHEINNLLLPISALTRMALKRLDDDNSQRPKLEKVIEASDRASGIIKQVMEFGRQDTTDRAEADPRDVVEQALEHIAPSVPVTVSLHKRLATGVGHINVDADQIRTVMANLIANAIEAMKGNPGNVSVRLERFDVVPGRVALELGLAGGCYALFRIEDSGCGMDADTLERVFDPFFTTKEVGEGTGLGLSIAYGIVERHGGELNIESTPGQGTAATIYLPLIEGDTADRRCSEERKCEDSDLVLEMEKKYGTGSSD